MIQPSDNQYHRNDPILQPRKSESTELNVSQILADLMKRLDGRLPGGGAHIEGDG